MAGLSKTKKLENERAKFKVKCKCGHVIVLTFAERTICSHCNHWVYKDKKAEFKYKTREVLIKQKGK